MGNALSSRAWPMAARSTADTQPTLVADSTSKQAATAPLFLDEFEPTTAQWSQESRCVSIQRFFGWLPDSSAEKLKQDQKSPLYAPRVVAHTPQSRKEALRLVIRWYRRFRARRMWNLVMSQVLEIARNQIEDRAMAMEEEEMLLNFRQILSNGFSAQKVSITGKLKNVQLQLVLKPEQEECYLTWTPSRKRQPRINLCDVQEVVRVLKEGNTHVPHLANKVSHRRGFIIVCKSHHRGRVVLQVGSKRERKLLVLGFQRLIEELSGFAPVLDDAGVIRKRLPRRQSTIKFFDVDQTASPGRESRRNDDKDSSMSAIDPNNEAPENETQGPTLPSSPPAKLVKRQSTGFERFYKTRYDDSLAGAASTAVPKSSTAVKPSFMRRSSTVK